LSLSPHETPGTRYVAPSPFLTEIAEGEPVTLSCLPLAPEPEVDTEDEELLSITFSELGSYADCGFAYRLRTLLGFQPPIAPELGYGKAVPHVLREVAEETRRRGRVPSARRLDRLFDEHFYLPAANKPAHRQLKAQARRLVDRYISDHCDDLRRVWAVERPFELHLSEAVVTGRADVILDLDDDQVRSLAIVDYKTRSDGDPIFELQLQVYTDAGRREGLNVSAAYLHDLRTTDRKSVDVTPRAIAAAEGTVVDLVQRLKDRDFKASPDRAKCAACDVDALCSYSAAGRTRSR
jgi:DNA helicase II / ATP-dependent DNA helicase PcrA